jgi:hypothetical protein
MSNPKLALIPSGYKNSKVYSILPNDGSGDFTFARNSGGTRVNKQGLIEQMQTYGSQLLNNSDFTSTSDWTVNNTGSAASVIENGYLHINTSSDYTEATQSIGLTAGDTYRVDYEILESTAGTISIIGNGGASTIIPSTVGKHTIEYDAQAVFAIKRTTGSTNIKIAYIKVYKVQYNTPRLDWSDSNCPSLLLESQSTNLVPYSEDFNNAWYFQNTADIELSNNISPEGIKNAYKITYGSGGNRVGGANFSLPNTQHTNSIYMRKISGSGVVNFRSPINNTNNVTLTDQWERYSVTATLIDGTARLYFDLQTLGDVIEVFGAQQEEKSHPTSYIPTFAGTSTRLADTCTGSTDATIFNDSEGVLYMEIQALSDDATYRLISISDGSTNKITLGYSNQNNALIAQIISGGSNEVNLEPINVSDITDFNKIAFSYKTNDCKVYVNGSLVATDTNATMPTGLNQLNFDYAYALDFYGRCKDLRYYDTALTDAELTELTT